MKKIFTTTLFLLVLFSLSTKAQFKLGLEPALGMNFNIHNGSDLPKSGSGFGLVAAGQVHMSFSNSIGMVAGLAFYDNRSGSYSSTDSQGGVAFNQDVSSSLAYFQIESLFKYTLPSEIYFVFGPELGFNVESESEVVTKITTPGYVFPGGGTSQTNKASIKDTQVRFELKLGAGYEIPITKKMQVVPQFTFGYGLTNVVKDVKWKILSFQILCGVKFDLI